VFPCRCGRRNSFAHTPWFLGLVGYLGCGWSLVVLLRVCGLFGFG